MLSVTVDSTRVDAWFDNMPAEIMARLRAKVQTLTINLQGHIVRDKLQGQVLHHRSGRLGSSIQEKVTATADTVTGDVFSAGDVKYAAIHEYGFNGTVNVKASVRTILFGKTVPAFTVPAHSRHINMPERSFMRSSLADQADAIVAGLRAAAIEGARGSHNT